MDDEPEILINGHKCTPAMAMTIRVALSSFLVDLQHQGLGDDPTGQSICEGYKRQIAQIHNLIFMDGQNDKI